MQRYTTEMKWKHTYMVKKHISKSIQLGSTPIGGQKKNAKTDSKPPQLQRAPPPSPPAHPTHPPIHHHPLNWHQDSPITEAKGRWKGCSCRSIKPGLRTLTLCFHMVALNGFPKVVVLNLHMLPTLKTYINRCECPSDPWLPYMIE